MKKGITTVFLTAAVLIFCLGCQTYQLGLGFEPRQNANTTGLVFGGDIGEHAESSISFINKPYPDKEELDAYCFGYDINFKYPFYLLNNRLSLFPMAGLESRFIIDLTNSDAQASDFLGFGVKLGGGLDVSITPAFYLRGTLLYQPDIATLWNSYPGFRFNLALGYRTSDSKARDLIERGDSKQAAQKKEQDKQQQEQERKQRELLAEQEKEQNFQKAAAADPNNPKPLYDLGWYYFSKNMNVKAAEPWENALKLDPNYRTKEGRTWSVSTASQHGVAASENIQINDYSLQMQLAFAYYDAATKSGTNPDSVVTGNDKSAALEKALVLFRGGYNIDITNGKNNNRNLKTVYLGSIAKTLDLLGRTTDANSTYTELSKIANVTDSIASRIGLVRIPARMDIPGWVKMGMTLTQARGQVPGNRLVQRSDVQNQYMYLRDDKDLYILEITPEKGLVSFQMGIYFDVRNAVQILTQRYGKPIRETDESILWFIEESNPKNITGIKIYIYDKNYNYLNLEYIFSNFLD